MRIREYVFTFCLGSTFAYGLTKEEPLWIIIGLVGIILKMLDRKEKR